FSNVGESRGDDDGRGDALATALLQSVGDRIAWYDDQRDVSVFADLGDAAQGWKIAERVARATDRIYRTGKWVALPRPERSAGPLLGVVGNAHQHDAARCEQRAHAATGTAVAA